MDSLPAQVGAAEGLTRFLVHTNQFTASTGRVRPSALMPYDNRQKQRSETSMFRTDGLQADGVWALGYQFVENLAVGRRIRARGLGIASVVTAQGLRFDVSGQPYPRHADIIGWPNGDDRAARMMLATEIANSMTLEIDPRA